MLLYKANSRIECIERGVTVLTARSTVEGNVALVVAAGAGDSTDGFSIFMKLVQTKL